MPELLSPADLSALQAERGPVHMHVGGVLVLDGPVDRDAVVARIRARLHLIPRYAMRLSDAWGALANVRWVEDERFDPGRHVRRIAAPAPGGDRELAELVGDLMSEPLDRTRPLWQIHLVEGLVDGRTAVLARMHHALVDGISAVDVSTVILDPTPEGIELPPPPPEEPEVRRGGRRVEQLSRLAGQLDLPLALAREAASRRASLDPRHAARQVRDAADTLTGLARIRPSAPETRINAEIGRDRVFALARGRLDEIKAIRRATGATVNDVILTAVALMLSDFLGGEAPERVVALVPVSIRTDDQRGELGNRLSMLFVDLPLRGEPLDRLSAVSAEMAAARDSPQQVKAGAFVVGAAGIMEPLVSSRLMPPLASAVALRALSGPAVFNLVVSNVPGPQQPFYLAGVRVREVFPAVPLNPRNQALSVGLLSYDGGVYCGLLADRDAVADVEHAASGLERAFERLSAAASG